MSAITNTAITLGGLSALSYTKAHQLPLVFSRMKIGDGFNTGKLEDQSSLVNVKLDLPLSNIEQKEGDVYWIEASMSNNDLTEGFYYREIGLYCQNPENPAEDILYCYGNAGELAEFVVADNSKTAVLKTIRFILSVSNEQYATINLNDENHATNNYVNTTVNNAVNSQRTNCILEMPRDINVVNDNGVFKLKTGSKLYIPNGSVYDTFIADKDYSLTLDSNYSGQLIVIYRKGVQLDFSSIDNFYSGETSIKPVSGIFYDTTINKIDYYSSSTAQGRLYSFPLAKITVSKGSVLSIDKIFNGFGFIGSLVYALPGIKALIPNGLKDNMIPNNIELTTDKVSKISVTTTETSIRNVVLNWTGFVDIPGGLSFDTNKNFNYNYTSQTQAVDCGKVYYTDGKVSDMEVKDVFKATDYNEFQDEKDRLNLLINEKDFEISSLGKMIEFDLTKLLIHVFEDITALDLGKGDSNYWKLYYYDRVKHIFVKNDTDQRVLYIGPFTVNTGNNKVWVDADWENVSNGSLTISVSRDGAYNWTTLTRGSLTDISTQPAGTSMFLMVTAKGKIKLKNLAWGMKS